jgi:hypothetical protein
MPRWVEGVIRRFIVLQRDFAERGFQCLTHLARGKAQFREPTENARMSDIARRRDRLPHLAERCLW